MHNVALKFLFILTFIISLSFYSSTFAAINYGDGIYGSGIYSNSDATAPVRSAGLPSGSQSAGTTQVTLSLTTDESSTCKYGTTANTAYASIASTFTTTGSTSHTQTIAGLTNGQSYNYYIRCVDGSSNANSDDYTISFSVASPALVIGNNSGSSSGSSIRTILPPSANPVYCPAGYAFSTATGERCTTSIEVFCPPLQLFSVITGERCNATISSSVPGYNFGPTTLRNGTRGETVKDLQRFLNTKLNLGLVVDGILGPKTTAVIKIWQTNNGLVADGIVGPKTKARMNAK